MKLDSMDIKLISVLARVLVKEAQKHKGEAKYECRHCKGPGKTVLCEPCLNRCSSILIELLIDAIEELQEESDTDKEEDEPVLSHPVGTFITRTTP